MIYIKTLKWKNFLSTGNVFTELDLHTKDTTLITGKNGEGKCVDPTTQIEIRFDNVEIEEKFKKFFT